MRIVLMAELLHINEPGASGRAAPQWRAFLELGFRPFYLLGCLWAALSVALWVYLPQLLTAPLGNMFWHAHEMLWAFLATIAVGFLFTAGATWTGINPSRGWGLGAFVVLWIIARIGFLIPTWPAFWVAAGAELLFFAGAAVALGHAIYSARSRRNYGLPLLILALGAADAFYLRAIVVGDLIGLLTYYHAGLLCMAVIALLVARRVIPFFAMRAISGLNIPMRTGSGQVQLAAGVLAVVLTLIQQPHAAAVALVVTGVIALYQLFSWQPRAVLKTPLLWILYLGYAGLGVGLIVEAARSVGWVLRPAWPVHVIAVAGLSVLIIGMVTRTALGHLGRPLKTDASMVTSYGLVIAAALLRLLALLPSTYVQPLLHLSAACWVAAFALYLWRFVPMLIRPRVDQAPGKIPIAVKPAAMAKAPKA